MTTLPPRLAAVAGRVLPGFPAADIGSDHALLAAYLLESGICPRVIATDVGVLPLERARDAMTACQAPEYDCRLGFGLSVIGPGEVATVIIAGMGGRNIADILAEDLGKLQGFRRLILQPMNRFPSLFDFLAKHGFQVLYEEVVRDSGSLFLVVTVDPALRERYRLTAAERELGPCLLRHLDQSLVKEYVQQWRKKVRRVLGELARSERSESRARIEYLTSALREVEEVL